MSSLSLIVWVFSVEGRGDSLFALVRVEQFDWIFSKTDLLSHFLQCCPGDNWAVKALTNRCDIHYFWMCIKYEAMGTRCTRKKRGHLKKIPVRDPGVERAACCHSEVPLVLSGGGPRGCRWKHPSCGRKAHVLAPFFSQLGGLVLVCLHLSGTVLAHALSTFWTPAGLVKSGLHDAVSQ